MQLERSTENHQCCVQNSILASETGDRPIDALVNINVGCYGFLKKTYQQWIDHAVSENVLSGGVGLCFERRRYVVRGSLIIIRINASIVSIYELYFHNI